MEDQSIKRTCLEAARKDAAHPSRLPTAIRELLRFVRRGRWQALLLAGIHVAAIHVAVVQKASAQASPVAQPESVQENGDPSEADSGSSSEEGLAASDESEDGTGQPREEERQVRLSDGAELDRIIELYMAGEYQACTEELSSFLDSDSEDPFSDPQIIERGRLYYASCALLSGRRERARAELRKALKANPLMSSPDSLTFPPPLVSLFLEVRDEVQQLISAREEEQLAELRRKNRLAELKAEERRQREMELAELAQQESVIARNSRFVASLPFGAGQYQNGNVGLGHFFLVSEVALAAGLATSSVVLSDLAAKRAASESGAGPTLDPEDFHAKRDAAFAVAVASSWLLAGVTGVGILEAHLSFRKERRLETRKRELPSHLRSPQDEEQPRQTSGFVLPTAAPLEGGVHFGLVGTF